MVESEAIMKMKIGAMVFVLAASAAFAQTEDETPPMLPLPQVLQIATDLQVVKLAQIVAELRDNPNSSFPSSTRVLQIRKESCPQLGNQGRLEMHLLHE